MPNMLAYAQLLRLPNVFTAFADILMAACVAGFIADRVDLVALLLLTSGCLYLSGMIFNDIFDRHEDAIARPFRPIPSGRIYVRTAVMLAIGLMVIGIIVTPSTDSMMVAVSLAAMILAYDAFFKHTPFGPVAMGMCRSLNVLLGLSGNFDTVPHELQFHLMAAIGAYIAGVTLFARTEETNSRQRTLIFAAMIMLIGIMLALTSPAHRRPGTTWVFFPYLIVVFGVTVAFKVIAAIQQPTPQHVQASVKRSILGLILLDAVLASAFIGPWGLLLILLLLPARWLGQWVYST